MRINIRPEHIERFLSRITKTATCWLWNARCFPNGYGQFRIDKRQLGAHRVSWAIHHGEFPDASLCVCHRCDNPACVNPSHLWLGTHQENAADKKAKGRANNPHGQRHGSYLHPESTAKGERNGQALLSAQQVAAIRETYSRGGVRQKDLALQFGIGQTTVSAIIRKTNWTHV
jgi:hypothetical protein